MEKCSMCQFKFLSKIVDEIQSLGMTLSEAIAIMLEHSVDNFIQSIIELSDRQFKRLGPEIVPEIYTRLEILTYGVE